tara:strand:- start:3442 stop:4455 length:1014 start_codon:yes stop_codon:yes gene_type:complete
MSNEIIILGNFGNSDNSALQKDFQSQEILNVANKKYKNLKIGIVNNQEDFQQIVEKCKDAKVIIAQGKYDLLTDLCSQLKALKLVQTISAGTEWIDKPQLKEMGIKVSNNGGANAVAVAEHAIGLMFAVNRKLDIQIDSAKNGTWMDGVEGDREEFQTLVGKTVGIIGLGRIGSRVAKRLYGWECEIIYHDTQVFDENYEKECNARKVSLVELLENSDVITLHVPYDRLTRHLISQEELDLMKKSAILINTCRGGVVDENALIKTLESKKIRAAGLDVTEVEPIEENNPLLKLSNVILTPHLATRAKQSEVNAMHNVLANASRVIENKEPEWVVEPV